jgi:tetratricopeptide (TPR) repeat protein
MERLLQMKERGNELFKSKQFTQAINCYEEALTAVNYRIDDCKNTKVDLALDKSLRVQLQSNLANCYFQLQMWDESQLYNGQLLAADPTHLKGRYRQVQLSFYKDQ